MRAIKLLSPLCALALMAACAPAAGPPAITIDRTACDHCGMLISEMSFAAAYRPAPGQMARVFDDAGCMLDDWRAEPDPSAAIAWVADFTTEEWISVETAFFVRSSTIATPMGGGIVAFSDQASAAAMAARTEGAVVHTFNDLVALPEHRPAATQGEQIR